MPQDDKTTAIGSWPIWALFKSSRHALQPNRLVLAAAGLIACWLYGAFLDQVWLASSSALAVDRLGTCPLVVSPPAPPLATAEGTAEVSPPAAAQVGLFDAFRQHVGHCVTQGLKAGRKLDFAGHMGQMHSDLHRYGGTRVRPTVGDGYGAIAFAIAMGSGGLWLTMNHPVFAVLMIGGCIAIWAVVGGAICRMATVRFARDERMGLSEALAFSLRKKWELILAPCLPLAFAGICAAGLWLAAWVCSWSFISGLTGLVGGTLFGLALLVGLGLAGGVISVVASFHLMWPTIAAEGSDFADAVGRGIMYTFQAIERSAVYLAVAVVYGSLAWMVVRGFGFLTLWMVHGVIERGYPSLPLMWVAPTFDTLFAAPPSADAIDGVISGGFVPMMVKLWVGLFVILLTAYLPSFYFTMSTIIYHVLRLHVDETDLDDIYLDDGQDDLPASPPAAVTP